MKQLITICLAGVLFFNLAWSNYCVADESIGADVMAIVHHATVPEGGSLGEFKELSARWTERVLKLNPHFSEIRSLLREEDNEIILTVIYVFADDPPDTPLNDINQQLIAMEWPDDSDRVAFFDRLGKYVDRQRNVQTMHSELLTEQIIDQMQVE